MTDESIAYHCIYQHEKEKNLIQTRLTQTSSPERESEEIDLTNIPEKEFKTEVITVLIDLQRNM